jgi:hypothetical protein|tara:strand:- start:14389 stop:14724 length:336 start_codon:yes stop_codon:yes gene_type:complete
MKILYLRIEDELYDLLLEQSKADQRSLNGYCKLKLQDDSKVQAYDPRYAPVPKEIEKLDAEICSDCDKMAKWKSEQDWETGEVKLFCDSCVRTKAKSEKMYKMLTSKLTKL